jgi:hypothetical protein
MKTSADLENLLTALIDEDEFMTVVRFALTSDEIDKLYRDLDEASLHLGF